MTSLLSFFKFTFLAFCALQVECYPVSLYSLLLIDPKVGNSHKNNLDGLIALQVRGNNMYFDFRVKCCFNTEAVLIIASVNIPTLKASFQVQPLF